MAFRFTEIQQTELPVRLEVTKEVWALQVLGKCPEHPWLPRQRFISWPIGFIISHTKWFQEKGTCWNILVLFATKHKESDQQSFQGKQPPSEQWFKNGGSPFSLKKEHMVQYLQHTLQNEKQHLCDGQIYTCYKILWGDRSNSFQLISSIIIPALHGKLSHRENTLHHAEQHHWKRKVPQGQEYFSSSGAKYWLQVCQHFYATFPEIKLMIIRLQLSKIIWLPV